MLPRRLSKYLSESTPLSHKGLARAHREGRVQVRLAGGPLEVVPLSTLIFAQDEVWCDGVCVTPRAASIYAILSKPAGIISTASDPQGRPCLAPWLNALDARVFPVGRLDRETTGLLLLTDDGDLAYLLLKPWFHVPKVYLVRLRGEVWPDDPRLQALREGVDIGAGVVVRALGAEVCGGGPGFTHMRVTLDEGRYRQVRRMCRAAGLHLEHLHRVRLGPVWLGPLRDGEVRHLSAAELEGLWEALGGRDVPHERAHRALIRQARLRREEGAPLPRLEAWLDVHEPRWRELPIGWEPDLHGEDDAEVDED